ncbi:defensin Ec-AMP-D1-like [Salvia hispanica]|uniref:defensin Ec-AMP-D1-like n=1 Tax=Salvia hispanica TaxID=49212 RepID=UPI0020096E18|nr:defensin Ec-AMP-D1-like [Salvia hispanica]
MGKIGSGRGCVWAILMLVLLLLASEMGVASASASVGEQKRTCESKSHRFKGTCLSNKNCGSVCNTEGFHGGKCRGIRRRCFCTRPC